VNAIVESIFSVSTRRVQEIVAHLGIEQLSPGIPSEDLRLEWEPPELWFPENCLTVPGLEGSVLVAVPMRLSHIGPLVLGGSCPAGMPLGASPG